MAKPTMLKLELQNLSFRYSALEPYVFSNVSVELSAEEYVAVTGDNGCGKSTLGKVICGLLWPTEGMVNIGGISPVHLKARERIRCAYYIMQDVQLQFAKSSLKKEIVLTSTIANKPLRLLESYSEYSLPDDLNVIPFDLSLNEAWRFALFLAEIVDPCVLFIDEAPSLSNSRNRRSLSFLVQKRQEKGRITMLSSQDKIDLSFTRSVSIGVGGIESG